MPPNDGHTFDFDIAKQDDMNRIDGIWCHASVDVWSQAWPENSKPGLILQGPITLTVEKVNSWQANDIGGGTFELYGKFNKPVLKNITCNTVTKKTVNDLVELLNENDTVIEFPPLLSQ